MLYRIKTVDGVKTKVPLAGSTPAGLPVGSILSTYKKIQPYNYLYCDGSTFDETQYPELYLYLGTNVLPDYRECVPVGAEKNTTDIFDSTETNPSTGLPGTQSHDVFSQGEFKDDQLQNHNHNVYCDRNNNPGNLYNGGAYGITTSFDTSEVLGARTGTTTRTKEKAVYYYIKAVDGVDIADENTFLNTVVNTIQDAQSYSTTEQKTGGKWIDGKMIYRKVWVDKTNAWNSNSNVVGNIPNLDKVVHVEATAVNTSGNCYTNSAYSGMNNIAYVKMSNGDVIYDRQSISDSTSYWKTVIVEYTKNE